MQRGTNVTPSQDFVPIEQVRDGILVLKDGSLRAVLMASSINIVLKSANEQAGIITQFQNFLNSLDFSVQIFIQSRELDIRPYLTLLEERYRAQPSDLMKIQVREYIEFVKNFVGSTSIMTKGFYIVVPYAPTLMGAGAAENLKALFAQNRGGDVHISLPVFEEYRSQVEQRISVVAQGLARTGVRVAQLGTEEVIELFYSLFNIDELDRPTALSHATE